MPDSESLKAALPYALLIVALLVAGCSRLVKGPKSRTALEYHSAQLVLWSASRKDVKTNLEELEKHLQDFEAGKVSKIDKEIVVTTVDRLIQDGVMNHLRGTPELVRLRQLLEFIQKSRQLVPIER